MKVKRDIRLTKDNGVGFLALSTLKTSGLTAADIRAMGFTEYVSTTTTPNSTPGRDRAAARNLALEVDVIMRKDKADVIVRKDKADVISMQAIKSMENVLDETESLIEEAPLGGTDEGGFTERERRGLDLELQTLRGNLKSLASKMVTYDSEIER